VLSEGGDTVAQRSVILSASKRQSRRLHNCIGHLLRCKRVNCNRDMRGPVERQTSSVAVGQVGLVGKDGPGVLCSSAAGKRGCQLNFKMNEHRFRSREKKRTSRLCLDSASAQRENQTFVLNQSLDRRSLSFAEDHFAVLREDLGNRCTGFCLDYVVYVNKTPAQARCHQRPHRSLAGAHESSQDDATIRRVRP
jgi:hypothetical protein